ncbi:MAG: tetratricopeptide repeat protein [Bryobacteraceae bacterium]
MPDATPLPSGTAPLPADAIERMSAGELPLNAWLGLAPADLETLAGFGAMLLQQGQTAEARKVFAGLIAVDPTAYHGPAGIGALLLRESRLEEAAKWLGRAATCNPPDPAVWANLGETCLRLGEVEQAGAHLRKALALDPSAANPAANRARALIENMATSIAQWNRATPPGGPR